MRTGDKVKVRQEYIAKIAEINPNLALSLRNQIGEIIAFDDISWFFLVKFENVALSFRKFQLEYADKKNRV